MDEGVPVLRSWRLFVAVAALLALAVPAAAQVEYRPAGGGFRVEFPARPKVADEEVSTRFGNTRSITATFERADGAKFYATFTDYPGAASGEGAQKMLDSLRIGRTVKGKLRAEQRFLLDGQPAQRETVDWQGGARPVIVALDVLRGLRLYSIVCFVDRGKEDGADVRRFLESFTLLPL